MRVHVYEILIAMFFPAFLACASTQSGKPASDEGLVGDWRGFSICQVRASACRDEDSVYRIRAIEKKPGWFSLQADRINDGKITTMGTSECRYLSQDKSLECNLPQATMRLILEGNELHGTFTLADNTLWRKINLKRAGN